MVQCFSLHLLLSLSLKRKYLTGDRTIFRKCQKNTSMWRLATAMIYIHKILILILGSGSGCSLQNYKKLINNQKQTGRKYKIEFYI